MQFLRNVLFLNQNAPNAWNMCTLESGINVAPWINIAPGKFCKKNKRSPIYTLYYLYHLNRLYEVWNKAVAPGKKSKINKCRGMFIPDFTVAKEGAEVRKSNSDSSTDQ